MSRIIHAGIGLLFMKVGTHAQESLEDIIARKTKEIEEAGYGLWGYGGNTCHPQTMVQPFAKAFERRGETIQLCMHPMTSNHRADPLRADESSPDGVNWSAIPSAIRVLGSRYALVIKSLRKDEFELPLDRTLVAVGPSKGLSGASYINGRVDKACLEVTDKPILLNAPKNTIVKIGLVAELAPPYAVLLRNKD
jgi:hypothetical protein